MRATVILDFLLTALVAGVLGAAAMEYILWAIQRAGAAKADMVVALGSLVTRSRENARRMGRALHLGSGLVFATGYALALVALHATSIPGSLVIGLGIGFFHGMIVSFGLMFVVAERHPLKEFQEVDLAIALAHLAAHVAFGATVGVVVGLSPL